MSRRPPLKGGVVNHPLATSEDNVDEVRRKRKREVDRRCQRIARDRTRNRMTELENMVEELSRPDKSSQIAFLMQQLAEVRKERDELARTMASIASLSHGKVVERVQEVPDLVEEDAIISPMDIVPPVEEMPLASNFNDSLYSELVGMGIPYRHMVAVDLKLSPSGYETGAMAAHVPFDSHFTAHGATPADATASSLLANGYQTEYQPETFSPISFKSEIPSNCTICCSDAPSLELAPKKLGENQNRWQFASQVLTIPHPSEATLSSPLDTVLQDNVCVLAVLSGWDAVCPFSSLSPSWQKLRLIDENIFPDCRPIERLAILKLMHKQLHLDANPTAERRSDLPSWYLKRPSQSIISHPYAIDFFAWPGMRERFVFLEHRYCANTFWEALTVSFRMLWPYDFRDCYISDPASGIYRISPEFNRRINDLQCWALGPDIFDRYPEFHDDGIPLLSPLPRAIDPLGCECRDKLYDRRCRGQSCGRLRYLLSNGNTP